MAGLNKQKRTQPGDGVTAAAQLAATARDGLPPPYASSHIGRGRKRITVDLDVDLHEQLLDAVSYAQHHGDPEATKVGTIHRGIELALIELSDRHDVAEWPPRPGPIRQG